MANLENICVNARRLIVETAFSAQSSHLGSSLSIVEILVGLYYELMDIDPALPYAEKRDRFILSKGHGALALYSILALKGFFPLALLKMYGRNESIFSPHVNHAVPGVEFSSGSLGHGLSYGIGQAIALKKKRSTNRVYVLCSDGELNEGSNWEAIMFAGHHKLSNLTLIVDMNGLQSLGNTSEILYLHPLDIKLINFGWNSSICNGHDIKTFVSSINKLDTSNQKPSVILAQTIKGKGISFMENDNLWHYRPPNESEFKSAMTELSHA